MKRVAARRLTAMLMAMVMALSLLPVTALAVGTDTVFDAEGNLPRECGVWIAGRCEGTTLRRGFTESEQRNVEVFCDANGSELVYLVVPDGNVLTVKKTDDTGVLVQEVGTTTINGEAGTVYTLTAPDVTTTYTVTRADSNGNYPESFRLTLDRSPVLGGDDRFDMMGVRIFTGLENGELRCDERAVMQRGDVLTVVPALLSPESKYLYFAVYGNDTVKVDGQELTDSVGLWRCYWHNKEDGQSGVELCRVYRLAIPTDGKSHAYQVTRSDEEFRLRLECGPLYERSGEFMMDEGVGCFSGLDAKTQQLVWDRNTLIRERDGGVRVNGTGQQQSSVILTTQVGSQLTVNGGSLKKLEGLWVRTDRDDAGQEFTEFSDIYRLTVDKPSEGTTVPCVVTRSQTYWNEQGQQVTDSRDVVMVFDFDCKINGEGQDTTYWREYTTPYSGGRSKVTVKLDALQAQVVTLPDKINENNELIITVHNAAANNEAVWQQLAREGDYLVGYCFDSVEAEGVAKPMVKSTGGGLSIDESLNWIRNHDYADYNIDNPNMFRTNGLFFAWVGEETERTVIIPKEDRMTSAWMWKYADGTEVRDGVIVKIVLDEDIANAIVVPEQKLPAAAKDRVEMMQYNGFNSGSGSIFDGSYDESTGVFTYRYTGTAAGSGFVSEQVEQDVEQKAKDAKLLDQNGVQNLGYELLRVQAPAGYTAKEWYTSFDGNSSYNNGEKEMELWYPWCGLGYSLKYTLVWQNAAGEEIVEQITVHMPAVAGAETWMDHIAARIPDGNVRITQSGMAASGAEITYRDGLLWTDFESGRMVDAEKILSATYAVKVPEGAAACKLILPGDGSDDATYNANNRDLVSSTKENVDKNDIYIIKDGETYLPELDVGALLYQKIGDIEYYYSADRGTNVCLIKWIFDLEDEDNGARYEYLRLDTEPYYCQWTAEVKADKDVTGRVEVPTATTEGTVTKGIELVSRTHPQDMADKFFFELEMVDGDGNTYIIPNGDKFTTIILPYEFMGTDKDGNPWTYETARRMKEAKIQHYDKEFKLLKGNAGTLKGVFTERGIEFTVDSFSPFMLVLSDAEQPSTPGGGSSSGGSSSGGSSTPAETKPAAKPVSQPAGNTESKTEEKAGATITDGKTVIPMETEVKDGTAEIKSVDTEKLIEAAKENDRSAFTLDLSKLESDRTIDTVELPAEVIDKLAETGEDATLTIVMGDGTAIDFGVKALAGKLAEAGGDTLRLSVKDAADAGLNQQQTDAIGGRPAFDINLFCGDVQISAQGGSITIRVPYLLRSGEDGAGLVVYYVNAAGEKVRCETFFDAAAGMVSWITDHLSVYMVDYEAPADGAPADEVPAETDGGIGLWIGIGVAALAVAAVVIVVCRKRGSSR